MDSDQKPLYPEIVVIQPEGSAFGLLGRVKRALVEAGVPAEKVSEFYTAATSGDYGTLVETCAKWVTIE